MADPEWRYEPADDLDRTFIERMRRFPRKPDLTVWLLRSFFALLLRAYLKVFHRFSVSGRERLPQDGSFILVANHTSHLDALCLISLMPFSKLHRVFPVAARDYFYATIPRTLISAIFVNALPFGRYSGKRQSLMLCQELLANPGNVMILFPEGTRSVTGEIGDFKAGVGILAAGTAIPVVPCRIEGAFEAYPKGRLLPLPGKVRVVIGHPLAFQDRPQNKESALTISEELRKEIIKLSKEKQR